MADESGLSAEQLMQLYRMGMMSGVGNSQFSQGGAQYGVANAGFQNATTPSVSQTQGSVQARLPIGDNVYLTPAMQAVNSQPIEGGKGYFQFSPSVFGQAGPISARYGQSYSPQGTAQTYGLGAKLGPADLSYQRTAPEHGPAMDAYSAMVPVGGANVMASVSHGKGTPTQYQGGIMVPGLLGGDLSLTGAYTPDKNEKAVYGSYKKRF